MYTLFVYSLYWMGTINQYIDRGLYTFFILRKGIYKTVFIVGVCQREKNGLDSSAFNSQDLDK